MEQAQALNNSFRAALKRELIRHRFAAIGMSVALVVVLLLLVQNSIVAVQNGGESVCKMPCSVVLAVSSRRQWAPFLP